MATAKPPKPAPLRRSTRVIARAPVTISGVLDGKSYTADAHILTISKYGARLKVDLPLKVGMEVHVQPKQGESSALFRVVWTGREDTPRAGEVGIEYVKVSNLLGVTFPE